MKKFQVILATALMFGLLFTAASASAGLNLDAAEFGKPTRSAGAGNQDKVPGAKATEKAVERAAEGQGGGNDSGNNQGQGNGNNQGQGGGNANGNGKPDKTPTARPADNAVEHTTQRQGNSNRPGKPLRPNRISTSSACKSSRQAAKSTTRRLSGSVRLRFQSSVP